jgi:SAM-dependent methyltransferase
VKILKDWNEIGRAVNSLKEAGLPLHPDPPKCWDLNNVRGFLDRYAPDKVARIIDLGCGPSAHGCAALELMRSMGYTNLLGIDLHVPLYTRMATAIRGFVMHGSLVPYKVTRGDITSTRLPSSSFDAAVAVSVVEHGVDLGAFFEEASRLLKPGRALYVSTDYWHTPIDTTGIEAGSGARGASALGWRIFDPEGMARLIAAARMTGLNVEEPLPTLAVAGGQGPVFWNGRFYTFLCAVFIKR